MKALILLAFVPALSFGQVPDPLEEAYRALKRNDYDVAISAFLQAVAAKPERSDIRKDLAYTYLKVGQSEAARDQFGEAMRLDPADVTAGLEYAFLCYESRDDAIVWKARARRIFDRIRKEGNSTAETAFQNIDRPLADGIERWTKALKIGEETFSAHLELAQLAEQRDQADIAAQHYLRAWQLVPTNKSTLIDLARALSSTGRVEESHAALLAASRGGETRSAEIARELLPQRYPYVYEFREALKFDPANVALHRELAYLLLKMSESVEGEVQRSRQLEAEEEFRIIVASNPKDLLSAAQLGLLYFARKDVEDAMPLLKRVLDGDDPDLANKIRTLLHLDAVMENRAQSRDERGIDARVMADKSYAAGFMRDALRYLTTAHDQNPDDYSVMLKLGFTENILHDDNAAIVWFKLARNSPDAAVARQARKAYSNLRPNLSRVRTTVWLSPLYSSRWSDAFAYGQVKTELRFKQLPVHPYVSIRFIGDTRQYAPGPVAQSLSESSFIFGAGLATNPWHWTTLWGEAGTAVSYLGAPRQNDYRGGVAWSRLWGKSILSESPGGFFESSVDGVFVSRFGNDSLAVVQNKAGISLPHIGPWRSQVFVNANLTQDTLQQYWANFIEVGPGIRMHMAGTPPSLLFSVSAMRGAYTRNEYNPRGPNFFDVRAGFWYAFTR